MESTQNQINDSNLFNISEEEDFREIFSGLLLHDEC